LSENNKLGNMVTTKDDKKSPQAGKTQVFMQDKSVDL
jgi:hypothetical protein